MRAVGTGIQEQYLRRLKIRKVPAKIHSLGLEENGGVQSLQVWKEQPADTTTLVPHYAHTKNAP